MRTVPSGVGWSATVSVVIRASLPEMHGRVGAPGAPRLRDRFEGTRGARTAAVAERASQAEVRRREGVSLTAGAHRDVLGRPRADAGKRREPCGEVVRSEPPVERERTV